MRIPRAAVCLSVSALMAFLGWEIVAAGQMAQSGPEEAQGVHEIQVRYAVYMPPSAAIVVQSNLVELGAIIRDRSGKLVGGLSAADFEVLDNGKPQPIAFFSVERARGASPKNADAKAETASNSSDAAASAAPVPRYIALFIDDTHSGLRALETSKLAAEKFVGTAFQLGDLAAIFTDSGTVTLEFTRKKEDLLASIQKIKLQSQSWAKPITDCPSLTAYQGYVISNHLDLRAKEIAVAQAVACNCAPPIEEACIKAQEGLVDDLSDEVWAQNRYRSVNALDVLKIAVQQLAKAPGNRLLVIVSPGFATGGMEQQTSGIVDAALRGHIVINALDSEGLITTSEVPEGRRVDEAVRDSVLPEMMSAVAAATGGQFIRNNNDLTTSLLELASAPEVSYLLGFAPANRPDDKYHRLKVQLRNGRDYRIQSRDGYYSSVGGNDTETAQERIDREVAAKETLEQIPVEMSVSPGFAKNGRFPIGVTVRIDAKQLKFAKMSGRSVQQLTFVTVLEDENGNYVAGKQAVMDLYLTPETLAKLQANGIKAALSLSAPAGSYRVREVVREMVQNHMAASSASVECR